MTVGTTNKRKASYYKVLQDIDYHGRKLKAGRIIQFRPKTARRHVEVGAIIPVPWPNFIDVMKAGLRLPERVVILGSGPNGIPHYPRIPAGSFVIALNKAITAPVPLAMWMAMDPSLKDQAWFCQEMLAIRSIKKNLGIEMIGRSDYPVPVVDKKRIGRYFPWVRCTFRLERASMMGHHDVEPAPDHIRPGCTVAGAAVQLCYHCGVHRVELCGVDMYGGKYFDGTRHKQKARMNRPWGPVSRFNELFQCLTRKGMQFATWSPTQLDLPLIGDG